MRYVFLWAEKCFKEIPHHPNPPSIVRMGSLEHSASIAGTWADLWPIKTCGQAAESITWSTLQFISASAVSRLDAKPRRLS